MIEADAVKSTVNMLESSSDNARRTTEYLLSRMVEHGAISDSPMIAGLTDSTQRTSGLP